jgi:hypothetical protein
MGIAARTVDCLLWRAHCKTGAGNRCHHVPRPADNPPSKRKRGRPGDAPKGDRNVLDASHIRPSRDGLFLCRATRLGMDDVHEMDDFQVIAERRRVMASLAALTDRYRELNQEISNRETLKWMTAR